MISYGTLILISVIFLILFLSVKVIKAISFKSNFVKKARSLGYKVYEYPWSWTGSAMYSQFKSQQKKYGDANYTYKRELAQYDLVVSNLLLSPMVEVINPQIAQEYYLKSIEGYYVKADFGFGHLKRLIKTNNLLLSEGHFWKDQRKVLTSVFNYQFIIDKIPEIHQITKQSLNNLQSGSSQIKCDISAPLLEVFSTVIVRCFFKGDALKYIGEDKTIDFIGKLLTKIAAIGRSKQGVLLGVNVAQMGLTEKNRIINAGIQLFRNQAKDIVKKRIKQIQSSSQTQKTKVDDIIQALIEFKKGQSNNKQKELNQQQHNDIIDVDLLVSEFLTFFLAGSETTLAFTRMMIYRLASYPQILQKVREQFTNVANTPNITHEQLKNLKYFQMVQKEVLRMDSSIGAIFMRRATKDHFLSNLPIHKNMLLNIRLRALHYKQSEYQLPLQFNPDRWVNQSSLKKYSYIPFSAGSRNCIGKHLALLQNKIFMIEFLRRYQNISISKNVDEMRFYLKTLYGPEQIITTLTK